MSDRPASPLDAIDFDAFHADIRAIRADIDAALGADDVAHLRKLERWGRAATALGLATCWIAPNPASAALLSLGRSTRWLLMHHVAHRGYDKVPGVPARYTSRVFAQGRRRFLDWPDWMLPAAWSYEHNVLHHYHTGEARDPDLIERNAAELRDAPYPLVAKYAAVAALALTWRASYYAPNTMRVWLERHDGGARESDAGVAPPRDPRAHARALWTQCYLPYAALNFVALPAAFLPVAGPWGAFSALANSLLAEALTNLHTFCVVGPNHTGEDLYRFDDRPRSRGEFFARQVLGSVNYRLGNDAVDFAHLWLNYQIEHHLFPDVPMLKYQQFHARVREACAKHGVPYVQESVFTRVRKMLDVAVGRATMRRAAAPEAPLASDAAPAPATPDP